MRINPVARDLIDFATQLPGDGCSRCAGRIAMLLLDA
jgi:hypothetical protein